MEQPVPGITPRSPSLEDSQIPLSGREVASRFNNGVLEISFEGNKPILWLFTGEENKAYDEFYKWWESVGIPHGPGLGVFELGGPQICSYDTVKSLTLIVPKGDGENGSHLAATGVKYILGWSHGEDADPRKHVLRIQSIHVDTTTKELSDIERVQCSANALTVANEFLENKCGLSLSDILPRTETEKLIQEQVDKINEISRQKELDAQRRAEKLEPFLERAQRLYANFQKIQSESKRFHGSKVNRSLFTAGLDYENLSREHTIHELAIRMQSYEDWGIVYTPFEGTSEFDEFLVYLKIFSETAQITHNHSVSRIPDVSKVDKTLREDMRSLFGLPEDSSWLCCTISTPEICKRRKIGTGWGGDVTFFLNLNTYGPNSLMFLGDVDQPDSAYTYNNGEQYIQDTFMTAYDGVLLAAANNWMLDENIPKGLIREVIYDELRIFGSPVNLMDETFGVVLTRSGQDILNEPPSDSNQTVRNNLETILKKVDEL